MSKRIEILDAIRGLCVVLMVFYHFLYNLTTFLDIPKIFIYNPVMNFLQVFFAGVFIVLCGISSNFSRSNIKRGLIMCVVAILITISTYIFDNNMYVIFGIIHFLAFCTLTYGLIEKRFKKLRLNFLFPTSLIVLFTMIQPILSEMVFEVKGFSILGFTNINFLSADYFPIFPWILLFYVGVYFGEKIKLNILPEWFYTIKCEPLAYIGKKSLIIYVLHQPVLMSITYALMSIE